MLQAHEVGMNFLQVAPAQAGEFLLQFKDTHCAKLTPWLGTGKTGGIGFDVKEDAVPYRAKRPAPTAFSVFNHNAIPHSLDFGL